jgi:tetratricopeptide (TPR) repeat protein
MSLQRITVATLLSVLLAACAGTRLSPSPDAPAALPDGTTPAQIVATIRAAGEASEDELAIQPLRANEVEHLREQAAGFEAAGEYGKAAAALDEALAVHADDPTVLQERAEAALLLWDPDAAAAFAQHAIALGADVGPLCRRHWATLEQVARVRLALSGADTATGSRAGADAHQAAASQRTAQARSDIERARQQREACTVAPPPRY